MSVKELLLRARRGENVIDDVLKELLPNYADEIKKAVEEGMPILIYDNVNDGCDSLLYHSLKNAGALKVPSYHIVRDSGGMKSNCVYLTVFLNEKAKENLHYI